MKLSNKPEFTTKSVIAFLGATFLLGNLYAANAAIPVAKELHTAKCAASVLPFMERLVNVALEGKKRQAIEEYRIQTAYSIAIAQVMGCR